MSKKNEKSVSPTPVKLGKDKDRSVHWMSREAVAEYVVREEYAEQLKKETLRRWKKEAEKGKTVPNKEVVNWLESWGADDEGEAPRWK